MKRGAFCFFIILFSISAYTQTSKASILKAVLSDSIVSGYMSEYGGIDTANFVLSEDSGYFFYSYGNLEFKEPRFEKEPLISGVITKLKDKQTKAVVKIFFKEHKTYYTKVKLERLIDKQWQIRSRLIYGNFKFPRDESRLLYYSLN